MKHIFIIFTMAVARLAAATYNVSTEAEFDSAVTSVNAGAGGDSVVVASGLINFTTYNKTFTKPVTLTGAGVDVSIITGAPAAGSGFIRFASSGVTTVGGITFISGGTSASSHILRFTGTNQVCGGNRFVGTQTKVIGLLIRASASGDPIPTGVSYNNRFEGARGGDFQGDAVGNVPWSVSSTVPGTQNAWYTENCYVNKIWNVGQNMFDHAYGGASVARDNVFVDMSYYGHGHDSVTQINEARSTRLMEVYRNTIRQSKLPMGDQPVFCNGGVAIVWGNTITGTWNTPVNRFRLDIPTVSMAGKTGSDYPLIDQPGRSIDSFVWTVPGTPPTQQLVPCYEWSNTLNGSDIDFAVQSGGAATFVTEGVDFYNDTAMPGYSPLIWPHPLRPVVTIAANARYSRGRR